MLMGGLLRQGSDVSSDTQGNSMAKDTNPPPSECIFWNPNPLLQPGP